MFLYSYIVNGGKREINETSSLKFLLIYCDLFQIVNIMLTGLIILLPKCWYDLVYVKSSLIKTCC